MLLIHGVACDGNYFLPAMKMLSKKYTAVSYDRRGYSGSIAEANADYSIAAQAEDAAAVIRAMEIGPAVVVGSSAGGIVGLELARAHPELVAELFLHEPPLAVGQEFYTELENWIGKIDGYVQQKRLGAAMLAFINALGGVDCRGVKQPLEAQRENFKNFEVFAQKEMFYLLAYLKELPENLNLKVPRCMAVGEKDGEGLFSKWGESGAGRLECPLLHAPGYHNLAVDLPVDFATLVFGAIAIMDNGM